MSESEGRLMNGMADSVHFKSILNFVAEGRKREWKRERVEKRLLGWKYEMKRERKERRERQTDRDRNREREIRKVDIY